MTNRYAKIITAIGIFVAVRLIIRYLLPLLLPFLVGAALAFAAEPLTGLLTRRFHISRGIGAGIGVSVTFVLLLIVLLTLAALIVRELGVLAGALPDLGNAAKTGLSALSDWLQGMARHAPQSIRGYLSRSITEFFSGGTALLDRVANYILTLAGGVLRNVTSSVLGVGTALISAYMISARLPQLRQLPQKLFGEKLRPALDGLDRVKKALSGWLIAQCKLLGVTWVVVSLGFLLLRIPYALLWAGLVALVDAFPILGTGTILIPWSLVSFLQGDSGRGIGLLGIYAVAALTHSALEPKLVGKQLGLDPLVTLFALYAGYQLWGLPGMLLAPLLAVAVTQLMTPQPKEDLP